MAYSLDGKKITALNRLVLEVVKKYVAGHKNISYKDLKEVFKDSLQGSRGVIKNKKDFDEWKKNVKDPEKRFFIKKDEIIKLNNDEVYVSQEWGDDYVNKATNKLIEGNKKRFLNFAKNKLKYNIGVYDINKKNDSEIKDKVPNSLNIKNIILYGAPGVGKTHNYRNLIAMIENNENQKNIFDTISNNLHVELNNDTFQKVKNEKRVEFVTFHQSYSYEDFIEGFRPNENGNIELEDGIFKKLCDDADERKDKNFYIVIDEINRGNISKIFGELITLIEEDKRDVYEVTLPYSKEKFKVPSNLYIIATMNSTDKSIATIDIALRRRFTFLKMKPNLALVENNNARDMMQKLNKYIVDNLNEDYQLGHSYFMKTQNDEDLDFVKEYKIKPLLEEYFYADEKSADDIMAEVFSNA